MNTSNEQKQAIQKFWNWLNELEVPKQVEGALFSCAYKVAPEQVDALMDNYNDGIINHIDLCKSFIKLLED